MLELLATSFPVIIRYFQLKRAGLPITVWTMKSAVFLWLIMAVSLFLIIFYFHPKSYSGLIPFRTVSVVAQTSGPVTDILVKNGQKVSRGDLLFQIENNSQKALLDQAQAEFDTVAAAESAATESQNVAGAAVKEAQASLDQQRGDVRNAEYLLSKQVGTEDKVRKLRTSVQIAEARLVAAEAQYDLATVELEQTVPAARQLAKAAYNTAKVALARTEVRSFTDGVVSQLTLSVGSPASQFVRNPAMIIIPERLKDTPLRIVAGFSQVSRNVLYKGMPAELACESNANLSFENTVLPAVVVRIQPAIATGQVTPSARLFEPSAAVKRGSILVYLELMNTNHEALMLSGSGCLIQTYTNNLDGFFGHLIAVTGVVKAAGLRLKVWGTIFTGVGLAGDGNAH